MSKTIPTIDKFMTTTPHSIGFDQNIGTASQIMKEHRIRHLPVLQGAQLTGVISDRDVKLALSLNGVDPAITKVSEISSDEVFLVKPQARIDEAIKIMAEKKIGSILVVDNHKLVGIFTTTDALRAFTELLETRLTH